MRLSAGAVIVVCLFTLACSEDPARSVKIVARPPEPPKTVAPTAPISVKVITRPALPPGDPSALDPIFEACPPPPEGAGPSSLNVSGPCKFQQRSAVNCEGSKDDFFVALMRKGKNGASLVSFLNVEHYHGPGDYDGAQMFITVQSGSNTYRWSSDAMTATVGPGEAFVTIPEAKLEAEPMLINCTGLIGPATNYQYQCGGRDSNTAIQNAFEVVSGKLQCLDKPKE